MKKSIKKLLIGSVFTTFICASSVFVVSATSGNYKVAFGDTMWKISVKNHVSLNELIKANPQIKNPSIIFPGQKINIPTAKKTTCNTSVNSNTTANTSTSSNNVKPNNNTNSTNANSTNSDISSIESEVIRLVNVERQKAGLPALKANSELSRVARYKSQDMADNKYFSHTSPTYGSPFDMMKKFGIRFSAAGENIAYGQRTAQEVMNGWMNSPGHRANILNSSFTEIGVGVYKSSSGVYYWTQQFIKPMN
ncbi:chlorophenol reductase precursor [Clostridium acetireducens DSM 10703]|uniref:Chlorophenol reductase n=1 Tax=Clostridium acetireducens DSM 10703 TaxID=1121290 RepID=A0A1E8EY89_9CLOT|nr:SafA/ExsA family spore coat assembly protein [Clostridium acetireducens]OFI05928.1 chlorophenol reductase precursor [Clostridium acetireducens DSM 10703]